VEDEKTLQAAAVVGNAADAVQHRVDDLLSDRVVSTSVVVRRIFLAGDELFRMEELFVCPGADLILKLMFKWLSVIFVNLPMTVGSRSTMTALGT
jgi:hypothetical protein